MQPLEQREFTHLKKVFRNYGSALDLGIVMERYLDENEHFTGPVLAQSVEHARLYAVLLIYLYRLVYEGCINFCVS